MRYVMAPASCPERTGAPRIVHVIPTALGRGSQVFARALVDELGGVESGQRLVSLFGRLSGVAVDDAFNLGGADEASGLHPRALRELAGRLRDLRPDVVVAHGGDAFKYLALVTRVPVVYCVIGTWPSERVGPARTVQRMLWRALIRRATIAAAVSDDVADDCRSILRLRPRRLTVIPNGRDATRYVPSRGPRAAELPHLAFVGHLDTGKRPDRFVELVRQLRARGVEFTASITGDGPLQTALAVPAAAAEVELTGWSADVVPHLQRADVLAFVSAPDGEGMPGVLIEAGLCGVPVVATRVAGASTVVEDGQTGRLVPVDDFAALVDATAALLDDPARRLALGAAARIRCEAEFALPAVARQWDDLLRSVHSRRATKAETPSTLVAVRPRRGPG
jgi:glycosyltransferase involved in cell wall biosynthesis